jgi:hypothetical protein
VLRVQVVAENHWIRPALAPFRIKSLVMFTGPKTIGLKFVESVKFLPVKMVIGFPVCSCKIVPNSHPSTNLLPLKGKS